MRPLKLTMTGVGPYRDRTVIDMEKLGNGGLYLITGDTGSGKTYIFDAITYALYGEMSGNGRDSKTVRSQYSEAGDITEVELEFEYRARRYTVTRNPEYSRRKKSGEGFTKKTADACLKKPGGEIVDGSSKVTQAVRDLLGIDRNQFCSIVMIAQGEFRRVLNAGTDERQRLFRKLFDTLSYDRLASLLKDMNSSVKERYDNCLRDTGALLSGVNCSFDETLAMEADELKESGCTETDRIKDLLDAIIGSAVARNTVIDEELAKTEKKLSKATADLALIESHKDSAAKLEKAKEMAEELDKKVREAEKALEAAKEKTSGADQLRKESAVLGSSLDSYDRLDEINSELKEAKKAGEEKAAELSKARSAYDDACEKKDRRTKEVSKEREKAAEELNRLIEASESETAKYSTMSSAYLREQAGILAGDLEDGRPCPVCGSVTHPDPARPADDAPSAEELEDQKTSAENAEKAAKDKTAAIKKDNEKIEAELSDLQTECDEAAKRVSVLEKESAELDVKIAGIETRAADFSASLSYESKSDAQKRIDEIGDLIEEMTKAVDDRKEDLDKAKTAKQTNRTTIKELSEVIANLDPADEEKTRAGKAEAEDEKKALTNEKVRVTAELGTARNALTALKSIDEDLKKIRKEHELIDPLSKTANGTLPGKDRITLEAYVQTFYFERIISRANRRLSMMSDGQYEFVRSSESGDKRQKFGLDLNVLDHYSGTERPVNTLSGGESFMASLSLALGLSDEVQSTAGGIMLDTMFIDEGFGSLDPETLEKAMRALTGLADEEKLVGIISHVEALRARIDKQIVVTKKRDSGSHVEMFV